MFPNPSSGDLWLQRSDLEALEVAKRQGYLITRHPYEGNLMTAWFRYCREKDRPCIIVQPKSGDSKYYAVKIFLLVPEGRMVRREKWNQIVDLARREMNAGPRSRDAAVFEHHHDIGLTVWGVSRGRATEIAEALLPLARQLREALGPHSHQPRGQE